MNEIQERPRLEVLSRFARVVDAQTKELRRRKEPSTVDQNNPTTRTAARTVTAQHAKELNAVALVRHVIAGRMLR